MLKRRQMRSDDEDTLSPPGFDSRCLRAEGGAIGAVRYTSWSSGSRLDP
jgi:hypothetical protein